MTGKRLWQIGGVLAVVVILALGWFVIVSPGLKTVDANNAQRATVQAANARVRADIANLSKVDVDALKQELATSIAQIPGTLVEEDVFDEIKNDAALAGVTVSSISITQPAPFAMTQESAADSKTPATPAPSASGQPAALAAPGLPIEPADIKAADAAGMYYSTVSISIDGPFANARAFVDVLTQQSSRTFLVPTASFDAAGGSMDVTTVIWFKPRTEDLLTDPAPAPSATPTPTPTPTPSATPAPTPSTPPSEAPSEAPTTGAGG